MPALLVEAADGASLPSRPGSDEPLSVLIVAKDPISHGGVERQLLAMKDVTVMAPNGGHHPDIALVVAEAVDEEVLGWIRTIRRHSLSRIVVVAAVSPQLLSVVTEAGADGILPRAMADGRRLAWVLQKVHRGDIVTIPVSNDSAAPKPATDGLRAGAEVRTVVSDRDREVLRLLAQGCDTGEIARTLAYSEPTIKNVIQRLFEQLKAKNRPHAVALALRAGII